MLVAPDQASATCGYCNQQAHIKHTRMPLQAPIVISVGSGKRTGGSKVGLIVALVSLLSFVAVGLVVYFTVSKAQDSTAAFQQQLSNQIKTNVGNMEAEAMKNMAKAFAQADQAMGEALTATEESLGVRIEITAFAGGTKLFIENVLLSRVNAFKKCIDQGDGQSRELSVTISPKGRPVNIEAKNDPTSKCLKKTLARVRFPAVKGGGLVYFDVTIAPKAAENPGDAAKKSARRTSKANQKTVEAAEAGMGARLQQAELEAAKARAEAEGMVDPDLPRSPSRSEVMRVFKAAIPTMKKQCPGKGVAKIKVAISPSGAVTSARITGVDGSASTCLAKHAKRLQFSKSSNGTSVTYPVRLN
jgi:hypothetical protein